ncbi:MAG: TIGR03960 family B12-binding radical SAM protein [Planctomycetaceae bacterium]|nr:TIGR03960 family B12-binding radical SAM protein [Planctomycetaceae bacterium]
MTFRQKIEHLLLSEVALPGQYIGGELGSVVKPKDSVRGRFCFAFPDVYTIGMSNYGLQLLYSLINRRNDWACERVFTPYPDMEKALRKHGLPLYSLETFSPLTEFDVLGFSLQYEMSYTNVLTMLDLGGIPLHVSERTMSDPLVMAGGPSAVNPEPMSDFIDLFIIGDGEESLPAVCDFWLEMKQTFAKHNSEHRFNRRSALLEIARQFPFVVVPQFYSVQYDSNGRALKPKPNELGVPEVVRPAVVQEIEAFEPPILRIVPLVECVQDRAAIEIMRGCPGRCKFCVSTVQKRPIRIRSPESITRIALESCLATGSDEVSLLSLSTSDYPKFEELMERLREVLTPLNISISVPSLRVNHQLSGVMQQLTTERTSGLTLAPEAALDPMRRRIGKPITNENLLNGCETAFSNGFNRVKMYFLCGLPEETNEDIDGIIDLSLEIGRLGKRIRGRTPIVTANVSNFVPKPHTSWERLGMQSQGYFLNAHARLVNRVRRTGISLKYHTLETSLLEALICRSDRRFGRVIEKAWQLGARLDAWTDYFRGDCWEQAVAEEKINVHQIVHETIPDNIELSWQHVRFS